MARDYSGTPNTCPIINEVISAIESVEWAETYWDKKYLIKMMEKIRSINETLRSWGNDNFSECEDLKKEIYDLEEKVESLELENKNLEQEVLKLESVL